VPSGSLAIIPKIDSKLYDAIHGWMMGQMDGRIKGKLHVVLYSVRLAIIPKIDSKFIGSMFVEKKKTGENFPQN
jgi:hypothetical protein